MVMRNSKQRRLIEAMMEPNHRSSKENRHLQLRMHELSQCSDTNFVTTQTQGYMTGTKGMKRLKVIDSQSKPSQYLK